MLTRVSAHSAITVLLLIFPMPRFFLFALVSSTATWRIAILFQSNSIGCKEQRLTRVTEGCQEKPNQGQEWRLPQKWKWRSLSPTLVLLYLSDLATLFFSVFPSSSLLTFCSLCPFLITSHDSQFLLSQNLSQHHTLLSTSRHFDISSRHCLTLQEFTGSNSQECDNFLVSQWIICLGHFSCSLSNHSCTKRHSALNNFSLEDKTVNRQSWLHIHQHSPVQMLTSKIVVWINQHKKSKRQCKIYSYLRRCDIMFYCILSKILFFK